MENKHSVVRDILRGMGSVAVRNLAGPASVPFGTIMNIRGGNRSTNPRYDNVYKLYQHFRGKSPCELDYVTNQLKAMTTAQVRELAQACGVSHHTLIKIKQRRQKFSPNYSHVHIAYAFLANLQRRKQKKLERIAIKD